MILRNISGINKEKIYNAFFQLRPTPLKKVQLGDGFIPDIYKNKCLEGIRKKVERVFLIKRGSGQLVQECTGSQNFCVINNIPNDSSYVLLHGHVPLKGTDISLPVSLNDFEIINQSCVDKIIAYDINGKQSFFKKNKSFIPLNEKQLSELKSKYIDTVISSMNPEQIKHFKKLARYCMLHPESVVVKQEMANILYQAQYNVNAVNKIDKFWIENAPNINVTYKSFSD